MISMKRLWLSFKDAGRGMVYVFKNEQNFRIQVAAGVMVIVGMLYLDLKTWESIVLILLVVLVLTMELFNTALEHFVDMFKPRVHPLAGVVKDIMAAAVLLTSLGSLIIGLIILGSHFL